MKEHIDEIERGVTCSESMVVTSDLGSYLMSKEGMDVLNQANNAASLQSHASLVDQRDRLLELLKEARPIVFNDHKRELGTRILARYTLTARIDAALAEKVSP